MLAALIFIVVSVIMKALGSALDSAFDDIADHNPIGSIAVVALGMIYLFISFLRHSKRTADAELEVLRIANQEGSTENDWAPFAYTAGQRWTDIPRVRTIFFGMVTWGVYSGLLLALGSEVAAGLITLVLLIPTCIYLTGRDTVREQLRFEESLKAPNESRWFPTAETPKGDDAKELIMDKMHDLAADILSSAEEAIDDNHK